MPSISNPPHPIYMWHFSIQGPQTNGIYLLLLQEIDWKKIYVIQKQRAMSSSLDALGSHDQFL